MTKLRNSDSACSICLVFYSHTSLLQTGQTNKQTNTQPTQQSSLNNKDVITTAV